MNCLQPDWPAPKHIKAYTTLRTHWGAADTEPKSTASEHTLTALLQLPTNPIWLTQTHSATVVEATQANINANADASFTTNVNHVCVVLTADCLPILICNKQGTHVAAIHAGWRGLANGIIETTLQQLPVPTEDLLVWLGPAIGPTKFEVGKDVYDTFTNQHTEATAAFKPLADDKWLANLYALATIRLRLHGIFQIYGGDHCTHTQENLFFSYRRDQGKTGRMASVIWIEG